MAPTSLDPVLPVSRRAAGGGHQAGGGVHHPRAGGRAGGPAPPRTALRPRRAAHHPGQPPRRLTPPPPPLPRRLPRPLTTLTSLNSTPKPESDADNFPQHQSRFVSMQGSRWHGALGRPRFWVVVSGKLFREAFSKSHTVPLGACDSCPGLG